MNFLYLTLSHVVNFLISLRHKSRVAGRDSPLDFLFTSPKSLESLLFRSDFLIRSVLCYRLHNGSLQYTNCDDVKQCHAHAAKHSRLRRSPPRLNQPCSAWSYKPVPITIHFRSCIAERLLVRREFASTAAAAKVFPFSSSEEG